MEYAKVFEVYGMALNGSRHNLGVYFSQSDRGAKMKAQKDFPEYANFSATLDQKITKYEFYTNYYHHNYNWSSVVYKG